MADSNRATAFAKHFQKHAGRAKELFRQNLGKADKTTDEDFDEYVKNFNKQTCSAAKLLKEVKNYQNCAKAMQSASKALTEVVCDLYEPGWIDYDKVQVKSEVLDKKYEEFGELINDQVVKPLVAYSEQFPEISNKILKRRRKLLDYDCCRHTIQNLEQHSKKREDAKIAKAKEQMMETQALYDAIHKELREELPELYDSRISFLASNLHSLFVAEMSFRTESAKIFCDLNDAVELLATESQKGVYTTKESPRPDSVAKELIFPDQAKNNGDAERSSSSEYMSAKTVSEDECLRLQDFPSEGTLVAQDQETAEAQVSNESEFGSGDTKENETEKDDNTNKTEKDDNTNKTEKDDNTNKTKKDDNTNKTKKDDNTPSLQSSTVLYKVKAAYHYVAEDADELSFEPGEIINVIEFEDPEQQEEGWLMGFLEGTKVKGLFPSNFTKPM